MGVESPFRVRAPPMRGFVPRTFGWEEIPRDGCQPLGEVRHQGIRRGIIQCQLKGGVGIRGQERLQMNALATDTLNGIGNQVGGRQYPQAVLARTLRTPRDAPLLKTIFNYGGIIPQQVRYN